MRVNGPRLRMVSCRSNKVRREGRAEDFVFFFLRGRCALGYILAGLMFDDGCLLLSR